MKALNAAIIISLYILSYGVTSAAKNPKPPVSDEKLTITRPGEFKFVHCVPKLATPAVVNHYVFDLRNKSNHKVYTKSALSDVRIRELGELNKLADQLEANSKPEYDVTWISQKLDLQFLLTIQDDGGYSMTGVMVDKSASTAISCLEVGYEWGGGR